MSIFYHILGVEGWNFVHREFTPLHLQVYPLLLKFGISNLD
jgi:hypothetical protein